MIHEQVSFSLYIIFPLSVFFFFFFFLQSVYFTQHEKLKKKKKKLFKLILLSLLQAKFHFIISVNR